MFVPDAKGIAGGIPAAYTRIEESFYDLCERMDQQRRVTLWEYVKPGWTYHAKGLWYTLPGQRRPSLTLVGSPNFGKNKCSHCASQFSYIEP